MARRFRRTVTALAAAATMVTLAGGAAYAGTAAPARHGSCAANSAARGTVYVVNWTGGVTPIPVCTNTPGKPVPVGDGPVAIAITPDGRTAYVANENSGTVTPIDTRTNKAGAAIKVGPYPAGIGITPDGRTAYVQGGPGVTPISTRTNKAGAPIKVAGSAIVFAPDSRTAYVVTYSAHGTVTPVSTRTGKAGPAIRVGAYPWYAAITRDGRTVYVVNRGSGTVTPICTRTNRAGAPIPVGPIPDGGIGYGSIAITPNDRTAYVTTASGVTPINLRTNKAGTPVPIAGGRATWLAITPNGRTVYVDNPWHVTPVSIRTNTAGSPINAGEAPFNMAMTKDGATLYVVNYVRAGGTPLGGVTPVSTATNRPGKLIPVGVNPYPIAITPPSWRR